MMRDTVRLVTVETVGRTPETAAGAVLSLVLGFLLLSATVLGPLFMDRIRFHMSSDALVQYVGGEVVTAIVAVLLMVSAPAWWLGQQWPSAVAAGAAAYVVYTIATVVAGQEYSRYSGNAEKAFLLYAAITAAGVALLVISFRTLIDIGDLSGPRQGTGWVLVAIGAIVALLWLGQVAGFYRTGPTQEYQTATSLFWLIKYLDLGFVIPLTLITGLLQRTPSPGTDAAAVTMLGFLSLLLAALLFMALEMLRRETPGASWALAFGVMLLLAPSAAVWTRWLISRD
ncbi:hypothetical protein [Nocardioides dongkuii]|uniref:hypothetical protein n=1 Tax=Nocardioides dongkuii TaxID=2760089 RepID=UPI001877E51D|nr:hypothetical protein [Nocardioides dongkuii]